jgi:hypothetical protein
VPEEVALIALDAVAVGVEDQFAVAMVRAL